MHCLRKAQDSTSLKAYGCSHTFMKGTASLDLPSVVFVQAKNVCRSQRRHEQLVGRHL